MPGIDRVDNRWVQIGPDDAESVAREMGRQRAAEFAKTDDGDLHGVKCSRDGISGTVQA
jgi:hypothetical protein